MSMSPMTKAILLVLVFIYLVTSLGGIAYSPQVSAAMGMGSISISVSPVSGSSTTPFVVSGIVLDTSGSPLPATRIYLMLTGPAIFTLSGTSNVGSIMTKPTGNYLTNFSIYPGTTTLPTTLKVFMAQNADGSGVASSQVTITITSRS